jgi:hypothetical protein
VVGYDVFTKDENGEIPEQTPQLFSVEWNNPSVTEGLDTQKNDNPSFNEFTSSLFSSLQQVISELLPRFIGNKTVSIYLSLIVCKKQPSSTEMMSCEGATSPPIWTEAMSSSFGCGRCPGGWREVENGQCTDRNCSRTVSK